MPAGDDSGDQAVAFLGGESEWRVQAVAAGFWCGESQDGVVVLAVTGVAAAAVEARPAGGRVGELGAALEGGAGKNAKLGELYLLVFE